MLSYVINQVKTRVELLCSMRMEAKNKKLIMSQTYGEIGSLVPYQ